MLWLCEMVVDGLWMWLMVVKVVMLYWWIGCEKDVSMLGTLRGSVCEAMKSPGTLSTSG